MLFSRNWLAEYVDLPADPHEIARRLTAAGLNVEGVEEKGNDVLLDIDVTTNRPDCMNHFGLAREAAVIFGKPLRRPVDPIEADASDKAADAASVAVEDFQGCPRLTARVIRGVKIGPSPAWLRERLESIGQRSINNVVDVTNFVLWETGQPLHAYDLAKLGGRQIVARRARAGEELTTLDGQRRRLTPEMLVIADAREPVGLAGVMGGAASEVTAATTDILLESAHFDRLRVRLTAKALGMHTDASHRFERGTDPEGCLEAATRAARLIAEVAGGTVLAGGLDVRAEGFPPLRTGRLDLARLRAFAGAEIAAADVERWLPGLGFTLAPLGPPGKTTAWDVTAPSWRLFDFEPRPDGRVWEADLFEEAIRMYGMDNIRPTLPRVLGLDARPTPRQVLREKVRDYLAAAGYVETVHFAFGDPQADAAYPSLRPEAKPLRLKNPLSESYSIMRRSLVPNLIDTAHFNQRRGARAVRLFEIACVYYPALPGEPLPDQPEHVALVCGGTVGDPWQREVILDLFDAKGALEGLAGSLGIRLEARPKDLPGLLAGSSAELVRPDRAGSDPEEVVGFLGRIAAEESTPLYIAEIALDGLTGGTPFREVELPSRFPGVEADFTLTHAAAVPWTEIDRAIAERTPPDLVSWGLKDRYRGPGVPEGAVNTTISFLYNSQERSLTQEEVNERQGALTTELERRFGWRS
jgi:phenylalanyl-tRNA synthetase beta chain